ncbi:hypothetical protein [Catenovulum agarivorans]|uniref:hypothetical protein n=1 Tax=Catenovulum agarivorans TaxID=1172192 RepID=UPI00030C50AF|nr:hypothetical protein [Catenovulum agarivorans]
MFKWLKERSKEWSTYRGIIVTVAVATGAAPIVGAVEAIDATLQAASLIAAAGVGITETLKSESK